MWFIFLISRISLMCSITWPAWISSTSTTRIRIFRLLRRLSQMRRDLGFRKPVNLYGRIQSSVNWAKPEKYDLSPALRNELRQYFEPDIHLLEDLLGRDFSHWLEAAS